MPRIGFFGKLPARGDFLTRALPPEALSVWEKWLEASMLGAKQQLGQRWGPTYERAPVWRFWIGSRLLGQPLTGALAPSVDRVGRQFPLTFVMTGQPDTMPAAPLSGEGNEGWYETLDRAALEARHPRFDGDLDGLLERLPFPQGPRQSIAEDQRAAFFAYGEAGLPQLVQDVRDHDHQLVANGRSYWWTAGNDFTGPAMVALNGMPDPRGFAALLQGFGPPVRLAPPPPVVDAAPEWDAVEVAATDAPLVEVESADMGWAATIPPTEISDELRARADAVSNAAAPPPPPIPPEEQDASPFDARGHIRPPDPDQAKAPVVDDLEEDPWAAAVSLSADPIVDPGPPTPETSPVSNPWKDNDSDDFDVAEASEPPLEREEDDVPDADVVADDAEPDTGDDASQTDEAVEPMAASDVDTESDPAPDKAVAQDADVEEDAPRPDKDIVEDDTDPTAASLDDDAQDTPGDDVPLTLEANDDQARAEDDEGEDAPVPPDDASSAILLEDLPEEEDSPFGLAEDSSAPKKKSLRGLFSRRGPE